MTKLAKLLLLLSVLALTACASDGVYDESPHDSSGHSSHRH